MRIARLYARTSDSEHELETQVAQLMATAARSGYYVAGTYREFGSGATTDRPELRRLISDLQAGETVLATRMDRISQLPLADAEELINTIVGIGARISVPEVVELVDLFADDPNADGIPRLVLGSGQKMMLRLALQTARDNYEHYERGRQDAIALLTGDCKYTEQIADRERHDRIVALRLAKYSISDTAKLAGCSLSEVKRVCTKYRAKLKSIQAGNDGVVGETGTVCPTARSTLGKTENDKHSNRGQR